MGVKREAVAHRNTLARRASGGRGIGVYLAKRTSYSADHKDARNALFVVDIRRPFYDESV
jgi:hypothetical protein